MALSSYHHWVFLKCIDVLKAQLMNINSHYKKVSFLKNMRAYREWRFLGLFFLLVDIMYVCRTRMMYIWDQLKINTVVIIKKKLQCCAKVLSHRPFLYMLLPRSQTGFSGHWKEWKSSQCCVFSKEIIKVNHYLSQKYVSLVELLKNPKEFCNNMVIPKELLAEHLAYLSMVCCVS